VKGDLFPPVFPAMELLSPPHYFDSNYNESSYLKLDVGRLEIFTSIALRSCRLRHTDDPRTLLLTAGLATNGYGRRQSASEHRGKHTKSRGYTYAQAGKADRQYLDYVCRKVPW
jgi:hypothetical protein